MATLIVRLLFADECAGGQSPERAFPLTGFQEDAARRARTVLRRRGGVVVADEVGMGKTYVALALIEEALTTGQSVYVIVPAHLRRTWEPLLRRLAGRVGRAASTEGAATRVHLTTHTRLSRGSHDTGRLLEADLVVVDEAHAFRNPCTRRYRALLRHRPAARLVLISATPINNGIGDLHALLSLFARDDAFRDLGISSLGSALQGREDGTESREAARVAAAVVVRRSRKEVRNTDGSGSEGDAPHLPLRFPARAPPELVRYSDPRTDRLVALITALEMAPYRGNPTGAAPDALLRLSFLKRLESGAASLSASLRRFRSLLLAFVRAAETGRLLHPGDPWSGKDGDDALQLVLDALVVSPAPPGTDLETLIAAARRDVRRAREMLTLLDAPDPKAAALVDWLDGLAAREKVLIFTEFRATAATLHRQLVGRGRVARVDGGGAWLGERRSGRRTVLERFAPRAGGAGRVPAREVVDVLIATDVLGEGVNLQDAGIVVSYDLPWNPVRLLQRAGRVDRLGSTHDVVRNVLFVPEDGLDAMLQLTRRLRRKLGGIARTIGAEDAGEVLERFRRGQLEVAAEPWQHLTSDPWDGLRRHACSADPLRLPLGRMVIGACGGEEWLVLLGGDGAAPVLVHVDQAGSAREADPRTARELERSMGTVSGGPRSADQRTSLEEKASVAAAAAVDLVRGRLAAMRAPGALASSNAAVVANQIRRAVQARPGITDGPLLERADGVLSCLAQPLDPATDSRVGDLLRTAGWKDLRRVLLETMLDDLEQALSVRGSKSAAERDPRFATQRDAATSRPSTRVLAVLGVPARSGGETCAQQVSAVDDLPGRG